MKEFKPRVAKNKEKKWVIFDGLCKGCGLCIQKCPTKALSFSKEHLGIYGSPAIEVDLSKCIACGICELVCPDSAIKVDKLKKKG